MDADAVAGWESGAAVIVDGQGEGIPLRSFSDRNPAVLRGLSIQISHPVKFGTAAATRHTLTLPSGIAAMGSGHI